MCHGDGDGSATVSSSAPATPVTAREEKTGAKVRTTGPATEDEELLEQRAFWNPAAYYVGVGDFG